VIGLFGAEFLMPVYLQALRGRTALETGFILLPLALAAGVATPIAGKLYDKIGPRVLVITGFSLLLLNTWQLARIQADTPISTILWLLALRGLALGMTVQTTFATALSSVPRPDLPRGSSLINGTRFVVQSIGVAVLATVLTSALSPEVRAFSQQAQEAVQSADAPNTPAVAAEPQQVRFGLCETPGVARADNIPPGATAQLQGLPETQADTARAQIRSGIERACQENVLGFERAYNLTFYVALVAVVIGAFLPGWPLQWAGRGALDQPAPAGH
jgi:hypothetical protein